MKDQTKTKKQLVRELTDLKRRISECEKNESERRQAEKAGKIIHRLTERKRAEEALKETNQNLQALIQASPLAIVAVDLHKNVLIWNPTAERFFGWREQEVLGQPTPIIPDNGQEEFQKFFEKVLHGVSISSMEVYRQKKDGTSIAVSLSTAPIYDANGQIKRVMGIFEEITERKKGEEERQRFLDQLKVGRERLRELSRRLVELQETERRDLARELHDEVGQNLTALSINLNIIQNLMPGETASMATDRINDSQKLVEETVICIRDVMARLRPPVLDDYGLVAALNWYSGQFMKRNGIPTVLILKGEELAHRLPLGTETALFRIAQEALNNVAKHAKASQITLVFETRDESVLLVIDDNGRGFDLEVHHQNGAQPEWGLINMRERAHSIGGQFRIESTPGKGTKIIVEVPRKT
jgi:two-component system, NarL family, sensor histidine kinase UhpB